MCSSRSIKGSTWHGWTTCHKCNLRLTSRYPGRESSTRPSRGTNSQSSTALVRNTGEVAKDVADGCDARTGDKPCEFSTETGGGHHPDVEPSHNFNVSVPRNRVPALQQTMIQLSQRTEMAARLHSRNGELLGHQRHPGRLAMFASETRSASSSCTNRTCIPLRTMAIWRQIVLQRSCTKTEK